MGNHCATCRHWVVPACETEGFGTCHLPSARRDAKLPPVLKMLPVKAFAWVATHETFGCVWHEGKEAVHAG